MQPIQPSITGNKTCRNSRGVCQQRVSKESVPEKSRCWHCIEFQGSYLIVKCLPCLAGTLQCRAHEKTQDVDTVKLNLKGGGVILAWPQLFCAWAVHADCIWYVSVLVQSEWLKERSGQMRLHNREGVVLSWSRLQPDTQCCLGCPRPEYNSCSARAGLDIIGI